jgi:hypothetical protein
MRGIKLLDEFLSAIPQPDGNRVARLDVAEVRRHVAGRENIGEEEHLDVA